MADSPSSSPRPAKRARVRGPRGRAWFITFNDRLEQPPSPLWGEEAQERDAAHQERLRAHAAAEGADEEEEAEQDAAAAPRAAGRPGGEVGDRGGHFCHPSEIRERLRGAAHISHFVGQLERGPENGEPSEPLNGLSALRTDGTGSTPVRFTALI